MKNFLFSSITEGEFCEFRNFLYLDLSGKLLESNECQTKEEAGEKARHILQEKLPLACNNSPKNFIRKVVDEESDNHVGYIWIMINDESTLKVARLAFIYIFGVYRGHRIGEQVMISLEKELLSSYQCCVLELNVFRSNRVGINLYAKLGFSQIKEKFTNSRIEMRKMIV